MFRTVRQLSLAILRDSQTRRTAMGVGLVGATALMLVGSSILAAPLLRHPFAFLAWWGACAWLTLLSALLALYDLLVIRRAARLRREKLIRQISEDLSADEPPPRK